MNDSDARSISVSPTITLEQATRVINEPVDNIEIKMAEEQIIKQVGKRKYHHTMNQLLTDDMRRRQRRLEMIARKRAPISLS